jgi:hypothetical protein
MAAEIRPTVTCDSPETAHPGFPCNHTAPEELAPVSGDAGLPCTCSAGYALAANCPNCSANLALRRMGKPHAYAAKRPGTTPTHAERHATAQRELRRYYPGTLEGTVQIFLDRAPRAGFTAYTCEGCGDTAAADNPRELAELLEHAAYGHTVPAGVLGIKPPQHFRSADQLRRMLGSH